MQRHVLGRVTVADVAGPLMLADADRVAGEQPPKAFRHLRHHARVVVGSRLDLRDRLGVGEAVARHERRRTRTTEAGRRAAREPRRVVVGRADPQAAVPALGEPMREADVIGVHVRDDDAQHRQAAELVGEDLLPRVARRVVGDAAVDDGPAGAAVDLVTQQPQVDVVERERQLHAHPAHARRDLERAADGGQRIAERVGELLFECVHADAAFTLYVNVNCNQSTCPCPNLLSLTRRAPRRFYEDCGLISPQRRGRNRVYTARDRTRLKLTLRGKRLGLTLAEVKELVDMYESPRDTQPQLKKFLVVLAAHREQLEQQLADLHATLDEVRTHEKEARRLLAAGERKKS